MPAILLALLPALIQSAPSLIAPLIGMIAPTLASKAPALATAVAATTAVKAAAVVPAASAVSAPVSVASGNQIVTFIQETLTNLGHPVTIDGELGSETIGAVEAALGVTIVPGGIADTILKDLAAMQ